jgi:tRNA(Arg) A34 adenosine deaminase TadA
MRRKITKYFKLAAKIAYGKDETRSFLLSAIGVRADGSIVKAINSPSSEPNRQAHAEWKLSRKLDTGSTVFVCRVRLLDGKKAMARPCHSCLKVLRSRGVSRVYFTTGHHTWQYIDL